MQHNIPFARTDCGSASTETTVKWLAVNELLDGLSKLDPKDELPLLLDFLVEYAGGLELAEHNMTETLTTQAALKYKAYAISVKKIKARILEIWGGEEDGLRRAD